jgi:hypothetical protein
LHGTLTQVVRSGLLGAVGGLSKAGIEQNFQCKKMYHDLFHTAVVEISAAIQRIYEVGRRELAL